MRGGWKKFSAAYLLPSSQQLSLSFYYHKPGRKGNKIAELTKRRGREGCVVYCTTTISQSHEFSQQVTAAHLSPSQNCIKSVFHKETNKYERQKAFLTNLQKGEGTDVRS